MEESFMKKINILPNSKWIECLNVNDGSIKDPVNPWENIQYAPRPKNMEKQFQPIANTEGLPMFRRTFKCEKGVVAKICATSLGIYNIWCNGHRVGTKNSIGELVYDEFNPGAGVYTKRVMATEYLVICSAGLFFTAGYNMISAILRGMGDAKRPFMFICIASVVNLVLDILFFLLYHYILI
jgi:hypothetical protein